MVVFYEFLNLRSLYHALWTLLLSFPLLSAIFVCYYILQKIRFRAKYSALLPGLKVRFYDVIIIARWVYFNEKSRKGRPLQSVFLQAIAGMAKLYENHKLACGWIAYHLVVCPLKGEAAELLLKDSALLNKNFMYKHLVPFFGDGLATSSGDKWKCRRKMLNPCFHLELLKEFIPIFNEQASKLVKNLQKVADGEVRELHKPVLHCVLDIVFEALMGVKIGAQDQKNLHYIDAIERMEEQVMTRIITWWMWPDFIYRYTESSRIMNENLNIANQFTNQILQQQKKQYMSRGLKETAPKRKSLLQLLLEHHIDIQSISDEDIRGELNTFSSAANDTTAVALNYALYFLGQHKDIQDNAQREVDRIFGDDKERSVEKEDLSEMTYIECVIKESMRIYPPIPLVARTVSKDVTICGYNIPKGSSCAISPYILHRDPEAFPNPEIFDPTRFYPENIAKRHPFLYIPFSAGPRNCIGQTFAMWEMKVIISAILRNFTVESLDHRDALDLSFNISLKPIMPLNFRLKKRVLN